MIRKALIFIAVIFPVLTFGQKAITRPSGNSSATSSSASSHVSAKEKEKRFLAENQKKSEVNETYSGLQYIVKKMGNGKRPLATDSVIFHIVVKLQNGTEVINTVSNGTPTTSIPNKLVDGLAEGLQLMPEGSTFTFFIPSDLAYGDNGNNIIPPSTTLIADLVLLKVQPKKIVTKGLNFANMDANNNLIQTYGASLYSDDMRYLSLQLEYDGPSAQESKTIYVKIINPNGTVNTGTTSPQGYSYKWDVSFQAGSNNKIYLGGWGNSTTSSYTPGTYKAEVYWDGKLQYQKSVTIKNSNIEITDINFRNSDYDGNVINPYGATLYSDDIRYLGFQLEYNGAPTQQTKTVYVKIIKPDGMLSTGTSSPSGYTTSYEKTFMTGKNNKLYLGGWGNSTTSIYNPGTYRIEIYWDGKLQYQKSVTIKNSNIEITGINFRNSDYDDNVITPYGSTLYSNNMRYLGFQVEYNGAPTRQIKTIYIKIINPDGTLKTGSSSPSGYTTSYEKTFMTGKNNKLYLGGWGNSTTSIYSPGTYRIEIYWNGKLQYQKSVAIY